MPALESKIADAVLSRIRSGRGPAATPESRSSSSSSSKVTVREATFADFDAVTDLCTSLGQGSDSRDNWQRLWSDNPAVSSGKAPGRVGWVLESSSGVVGFLGTIPLLYQFEGEELIAAATCRFAVEPEYRGFSNLLMTSFLRQKDVDLYLNTTATVAAGRIMSALKAAEVPQRDYGKVMFWVIDAHGFARVVLEKLGATGAVAKALNVIGSPAVKLESFIRGRRPRAGQSRGAAIAVGNVDSLDSEFDEFMESYQHSSGCLMAMRSAEILRWHFSAPASKRVVRVLQCHFNDRLAGYAVVRHEVEAKTGLRRSVIADLLVTNDDSGIVAQLQAAAYDEAKAQGSQVLEMMGFPQAVRDVAGSSNPYTRNYPANPFFYKARDKDLHTRLAAENLWYACPYDGDSTLWP